MFCTGLTTNRNPNQSKHTNGKAARALRALAAGLTAALVCAALASLVPSADADENLAKGMSYVFATGQPTVHSYDRYSDAYDRDHGQLTDGIYAQPDVKALGWLSSFRSSSRTVTFDFGKPVAVTGASADFLHNPSDYHAPRQTKLCLSDDGENWFLAGKAEPDFPLASPLRRYRADIRIPAFRARYVRLEYTVDVFALCDEVEIYGSKAEAAVAAAKAVVPDDPEPSYFCETLGSRTDVTDIIKIYNGYYPSNQNKADNTKGELLPYVGYVGKDGQILDTLFDAVAFVPCVSTDFTYPSGGTLVRKNGAQSAVMSDWVLYTDFLFASERDLHALDQAADEVFAALDRPADEKYPVLLTMHYPNVTNGPFGDLDGDGREEYTRTTDERVAVVEWYDRYVTDRFEQAGFKRLELAGWYWYNETIDESWNADEKAFTKQAVAALRAKGREVLYDPFYLSLGYDQWREYGFSAAVMQPNVSFLKSRPYFELEMLDEFAQTIAEQHLGVEVETDEPSYFRGDDPSRPATYYERYLFTGAKTGYMNALHTFYQGAGPGSLYDFAKATGNTPTDIRLRRLYDVTYRFIKGTYENLPPETDVPDSVRCDPGERLKFDISWTDADSFPGDIRVTVSEPEHGKAQIAMNRKTVSYTPEDGFTGTDVFYISVTDSQNPEQVYPVRVTVGTEPVSAETDPGDVPAPETPDRTWLYWLLGGLAAAVIAGSVTAIVLTLKKK